MSEIPIQKEPVAVIDIGSSAIRMVIAEVGPKSQIRYLENLHKSILFGKDVFKTGRISNSLIREGIDILKNYKSILDGYGIKRFVAIATSAIREAANRDNFVDQVYIRSGIDIEVIEGAEENRLELIAVEHALKDKFDFEKKNCLIVEVGTGHTEIIIINKGEVKLTRAIPIGSFRLPERAVLGSTDPAVLQRMIRRTIHSIAEDAGREFSLDEIDAFIAMGGDMRFVSKQLIEKTDGSFSIISKKDFVEFIKTVSKMTIEDVVNKFGLLYEEAEILLPSLMIYSSFLNETKTEEMIVPMISIRDGLLLEMSQLLFGHRRTDLSKQVVNSAKSLGKKYKYDEAHALCVANLALKMFDLLKDDHALKQRERMLLEISALLHDIGMYISPTSHHKHSAYLVEASEIFGLRKADKDIVSNVVRYHRRSTPKTTHVLYMSLPRIDRTIVSKLSALLRVADALDRSHQQKIRDFTFERREDSFIIWVSDETGDLSIEREGLQEKNDMFVDIFGAAIVLKQGVPPKS